MSTSQKAISVPDPLSLLNSLETSSPLYKKLVELINYQQAVLQAILALRQPPPPPTPPAVNPLLETESILPTPESVLPSLPGISTYALLRPVAIQAYSPLTTGPTANTPVDVDFRGVVYWLIFDNNLATATSDISVSFDGGKNYKIVEKGTVLNLSPYTVPLLQTSITVKSAVAAAPFEMLTGEAPS